jgi:dihydrofolate reductase
VGAAVVAAHGPRFDLVLGRRTYDIWAAYGAGRSDPMAESLHAATKHVATHRPESLAWSPAAGLGADAVAGVRRLKAASGPDLILWGSSTVAPTLLEHGLVDEVLLFVYPVLLGHGKRLFSADVAPRGLALLSARATPSGVLINAYRPAGPLRTGSFGGKA